MVTDASSAAAAAAAAGVERCSSSRPLHLYYPKARNILETESTEAQMAAEDEW